MTDTQILEITAAAFARCNEDIAKDGDDAGYNWADYVDTDLREAGIELADESPSGADASEIAYLADGRKIVLSDESASGASRYSIEER